ncbi:MAG TPA: PAS domain S-box protein [Methanocella sp.]|jgi:PAS domain S-box-containing protein
MDNYNASFVIAQHGTIAQAFAGIGPGSQGISSLLGLITDTLPLGFYAVDGEKILYFNDRFCEIWCLEHLKGRIWDGTLTNHDIAPEIVRKIDGASTSPSPASLPNSRNSNAEVQVLSLIDGRIIRRIAATIWLAEGSRLGNLYVFEDITDQAHAQENIRKSQERYKELADALPQIVFEADTKGNITFANRSAFTLLGLAMDELDRGLNVFAIVAPEDKERMAVNMEAVLRGGRSGNEYTFIRKDGSRMPMLVSSKPIYRDGRATGLRGIIVDITEQKQTEEKLTTSLAEKEMLIREVHHRVRNNLQVISSLLSLQMAFLDDFAAIGLLRESQTRVRTISLAYEKIYGSSDLTRVSFRNFAEALASQVADACRVTPGEYRLVVTGDVLLEPDMAVPCGLIMSELISGSLLRAVEEGRTDELRISVQGGDRITLVFEDNSTIAPRSPGLGEPLPMSLQLISMMVDQLEGTIRRDGPAGTIAIIEFPASARRA